MLLALASGSTAAQKSSPSVAPSYWKPWNEVRTYAPDLVWRNEEMPKAAFDALPKDLTDKDENGEPYSIPGPVASIDLNGDGKSELIVGSGQSGSGGPEYVILQQYKSRWRVIGMIQGGFTVSKRMTSRFADIETWSRHPETYHRLWKFSGDRYRPVRREIGLRESSSFDSPYIPGIRVALTAQANEFKKTQPCPQTKKINKDCPGYVIIYATPIERGGVDNPSNMRWQKIN